MGYDRRLSWLNALLALVVALAVQIGTNYANDYADGVRGTDEQRVGPLRLVAGGLATRAAGQGAALRRLRRGRAGRAGARGAVTCGGSCPSALACGVAGWAYTGGPRPYGYLGLGELFVFVFFGLVATAGSAYVQHAPFSLSLGGLTLADGFPWGFALWAGVPVGLLAAALLEANNLRDIEGDAASGKQTLAVRLGPAPGRVPLRRRPGRAPLCRSWSWPSTGVLGGLALAAIPWRSARPSGARRRRGPGAAPVLGSTARLSWRPACCSTIGLLL